MEFEQQLVSSSLDLKEIQGGVHDRQPRSTARSFGWQSRKLKSRKLILMAVFDFSRNFSTPENYLPYNNYLLRLSRAKKGKLQLGT